MDLNQTRTGHIQRLSDDAYIITGVYLTIIGIIAVFGNIFVLFVLMRGRPNFIKIHLVMTYIITGSDLLVASFAFPLTAASGYHKRWMFNDTTCVLCGFVVYFFTMCTMGAMCVVAITRYIIICNPAYDRYIRRHFYIGMWSVGVVSYALFWTATPLVGWSSYGPEPFETSCTLNWYGETLADRSYNGLCIIFCYCVPLGILVYCYYHVIRTSLSRTKTNRLDIKGADMDTVIEEMNRRQKILSSRHMTFICLSMVVTFFITWTPYTVITAWNLLSKPVSSNVQVLPTMFAKLNCTINPIIFVGFCERFREAVHKARPCQTRVSTVEFNNQPQCEERVVRERDITVMNLEEQPNQSNAEERMRSVDFNMFIGRGITPVTDTNIDSSTPVEILAKDEVFTASFKSDNCENDGDNCFSNI